MIGRRLRGSLALLGLLGSLALGGDALAARFAVLVGNNEGQGGDAQLRFAESDTARLGELLARLGGFDTGGTVVLLARSADELQRSIADLAARLRSTPGENLVLVYYSGHADAQALHMGTSVFSLVQLRETVNALPAATRVLILDACQAGVLTRAKGGRPGPGFEIDLGKSEATKGLAILAASSGSELAQESDQLRASVFTHYLDVGLSGLADRNRDGNVSLGEVFDYTAEHTLAATMGTTTGPQHPTFRLDLTGRDDLILTRPGLSGTGYGRLRLDVPGWYFVRRGDGTIAAELVSRGDDTLALEPGPYEVTRRERNELDVASLSVGDGTATAISQTASHPVAFGRMVRKGQGPEAAYGLALATVVRSPLEDLGVSMGAALAARADLSAASFELRLGLGRAQQTSEHFSSTTWDLSTAVAALRMVDEGPVSRGSSLTLTWAFGAEAGVSYMAQTLDDGARGSSWNPFAGPVALAELTFGRRFFLRADLGVPIYALRVQTAEAASGTTWRPALWSALGAGTSF
jgi:Caspase domain